jgi:predicted RNase H-like HicB family nuclease
MKSILKNSIKRILATSIIEKKGEWYIATCPALSPVGAQGKTKKDAMKKLRDVIRIYIDGCFESIVTELLEEAKFIENKQAD